MTTTTSTRGRKKHEHREEVQLEMDPAALAQLNNDAATIEQMQAGYSEERDLVNQLLGQAQLAGAYEQFSRTVRTSKLAYIKETKAYKAIAGMKTPHGAEFSGTWEEFCGLLGISVDTADRDIANLRTFGEEALESMSRMGIGYRELRQYRKLPEDGQQALIEVAKHGDKDALLELAEELIAKQLAEKDKLATELEQSKASYEANSRILADTRASLDAAKEKAAILPRMTRDQRVEAAQLELAPQLLDARAALEQLRVSINTLLTLDGVHDKETVIGTLVNGVMDEVVLTALGVLGDIAQLGGPHACNLIDGNASLDYVLEATLGYTRNGQEA